MDEVDKIILQSLEQLGCAMETEDNDDTIFGLRHFTPDLLVKAVSKCLREINPSLNVPKSLPPNMAQRFTTATKLAEICISSGYSDDIGYHTFLYPNVIEIRRLFMYLIERLPKDQEINLMQGNDEKANDYSKLMKEIKQKINQQLKAPWVPQYCRGVANRKSWGCNSLNIPFKPHLNLIIPNSAIQDKTPSCSSSKTIAYEWPSMFQQVANFDCDLISSVLHKNSLDVYEQTDASFLQNLQIPVSDTTDDMCLTTLKEPLYDINKEQISETTAGVSDVEKLTQEIESLKLQNEKVLNESKTAITQLKDLCQQYDQLMTEREELRKEVKFHERCSVILEDPDENVKKLEDLIQKTKDRRQVLENKVQVHKETALQRLNELENLKKSKGLSTVEELNKTIKQLETEIEEKTNLQAELSKELKKATTGTASRKEYTQRIHELIGSIRKQKKDIYKILDDTRELQKELNKVSDQLQRQFNYTDDLLFQGAKHNVHAKQAYKLLATLHTSCNEIYALVSQTGQTTKEIRELEVQIENERIRNVAASLEQITVDIRNVQSAIKKLEADLGTAEGAIIND